MKHEHSIFAARLESSPASLQSSARRDRECAWVPSPQHSTCANWRNQALSQACAFTSPFSASMSAMGMLRQLVAHGGIAERLRGGFPIENAAGLSPREKLDRFIFQSTVAGAFGAHVEGSSAHRVSNFFGKTRFIPRSPRMHPPHGSTASAADWRARQTSQNFSRSHSPTTPPHRHSYRRQNLRAQLETWWDSSFAKLRLPQPVWACANQRVMSVGSNLRHRE